MREGRKWEERRSIQVTGSFKGVINSVGRPPHGKRLDLYVGGRERERERERDMENKGWVTSIIRTHNLLNLI